MYVLSGIFPPENYNSAKREASVCLLFINYVIACSILSITSTGAPFGFLAELISGIGTKMQRNGTQI